MATKLFARLSTTIGIGSFKDLLTTAGSSGSTGFTTQTTAGGTEIQITATAGGALLEWISGRVPGGGVTIQGNITAALGAREGATSNNVGLLLKIFMRSPGGTETLIASRFWDGASATELSTTNTLRTWSAFTPTNTFVEEDYRFVVRWYAANAGGTMQASGSGCTGSYDWPNTQVGGAYVQFNETFTPKSEAEPDGIITRPGKDAIAFTGFAPTVSVGTTVSPGVDAIAFTGFAPTVTVTTAPITSSPGVDAIAFTGFAPSISIAYSTAPGVDAIAFTGFAPSVGIGFDVAPGIDSITFTGFAPTIGIGFDVAPGADAIVFTGKQPTVTILHPIDVGGADAIVFTGYAPTVSVTVVTLVEPGADAITFTGFAPTVGAGVGVTVSGADAITFTGFAPSISIAYSSSPGADAIVFTGFAPTVASGVSTTLAGADSITFTGFAPTVTVDYTVYVLPGTDAISFTGYAPDVVVTIGVVEPGTDAITFTGFSPTVHVSLPTSIPIADVAALLAASAQAAADANKEFPPVPPARSDMLGAVEKLRELTDILVNRRGAGQSSAVLRRMVQAFVLGEGPLQLTTAKMANLPAPSPAGRMVYVEDESGGAVPAFSDGRNWRRITDRNIVS